jgi:hypothetical protein
MGDGLCTLGIFLKISEVAHIFGQAFSTVKVCTLTLTKCFGQGFGRYFYKLI